MGDVCILCMLVPCVILIMRFFPQQAEAEKLAKEQQKQKMLQQQMQQQYSMHNSFNANMSMMGPSQAMGGHQSWGISSDTPPLHGQSPLGLPQPVSSRLRLEYITSDIFFLLRHNWILEVTICILLTPLKCLKLTTTK